MSSAREERVRGARTKYHDVLTGGGIEAGDDPVDVFAEAVDAAIETAIRVRITPEIVEAARQGWLSAPTRHVDVRSVARLKAAFEAAGFEVEE